MTRIAYPSTDFPGLPSVAVEVPDGWEPVHVPGTTLVRDVLHSTRVSPTPAGADA